MGGDAVSSRAVHIARPVAALSHGSTTTCRNRFMPDSAGLSLAQFDASHAQRRRVDVYLFGIVIGIIGTANVALAEYSSRWVVQIRSQRSKRILHYKSLWRPPDHRGTL